MTLFFHLPEPEACSGPSVLEHACSDGRVNRNAEWCGKAAQIAMEPPMTPEELAEHARCHNSVVAAIDARRAGKRDLFSQ